MKKGGEPVMHQTWMRKMLLMMLALSLFAQGAIAAEGKKTTKPEGKYRQVTGEIVSIGQDSIVIKSRTKGTMTLAITNTTDMIGTAVKAGDKATVNYRAGHDKNTATRISAKSASDKAGKKQTAALSAVSAKTR
jgi:hypothetical protein